MPGKQREKLLVWMFAPGTPMNAPMLAMCFTRSARNLPFCVDRKLGLGDGVARLLIAQERFRARRHPGDRPAGQLRGDQQRRIFRIDRGLHAERAADVLGDDAQLLARQSHHGDDLLALRPGALRAGAQRVAIGRRVVARGRAARLHGGDDEALVDHRDARDMRGAGENPLDLARIAAVVRHRAGPVERDIARRFGPELRRAGVERRAHVRDRVDSSS